ncbi:MAG: hypothetical protein H0U54_14475 [Acidobacteria bacterium]|nr:hypothetical protein [Acidobacteriota bacterium]
MVKIALVSFLLIVLSVTAIAQTGKDACHVYVVDAAKARQAFEGTGSEEAELKALSAAQIVFPDFFPVIGEEELTTKHYAFPGSKLVITASVFYTDESMASQGEKASKSRADSMIIGVTVSNRAKPDATSEAAGESVIAEVTYDEYTNKVRAKKYIRIRGRSYLLGIECDCMAKRVTK